jgi:hypothetical protein
MPLAPQTHPPLFPSFLPPPPNPWVLGAPALSRAPPTGDPAAQRQWVGKCSKALAPAGMPTHRAQWVGECSKGSVSRQEEGPGDGL